MLLLVIALGVVFAVRGQGAEERRREAIVGIVQDYLAAVAAGDAEAALGYLDENLIDRSSPLLTAEVLAASQDQAPLADVTAELVGEYGEGATGFDVAVSYTLGEETVEQTWAVSGPADDGEYFIESGTGTLSMAGLEGIEGVDLNGLDVATQGDYPGAAPEYDAFPGAYVVSLPGEYLTIEGETTAVLDGPDATADFQGASLEMTEEGESFAKQAVQDAVDDCVSSTEFEAGCGLDLPSGLLDGTTFTEGSIERSLTDDARSTLDELSFELGVEGETVATGEAIGAVDVEAEATRDGRTGRGRVTGDSTSLGAPSIDLAAEDPEVVWD